MAPMSPPLPPPLILSYINQTFTQFYCLSNVKVTPLPSINEISIRMWDIQFNNNTNILLNKVIY